MICLGCGCKIDYMIFLYIKHILLIEITEMSQSLNE